MDRIYNNVLSVHSVINSGVVVAKDFMIAHCTDNIVVDPPELIHEAETLRLSGSDDAPSSLQT